MDQYRLFLKYNQPIPVHQPFSLKDLSIFSVINNFSYNKSEWKDSYYEIRELCKQVQLPAELQDELKEYRIVQYVIVTNDPHEVRFCYRTHYEVVKDEERSVKYYDDEWIELLGTVTIKRFLQANLDYVVKHCKTI